MQTNIFTFDCVWYGNSCCCIRFGETFDWIVSVLQMMCLSQWCVCVSVSVCSILGGAGLGLQYNLPTVKLSLHFEREIPECDDHIDGMCQISNGGERKFTINRGTGACTAQFNSIQLKNVRRPDRGKNEELVTEHKYAFAFYCTVHVCEEQIQLRVSSCVTVINTHLHTTLN